MKDRKRCTCGTYYKPPGRPVLHEECRKCKKKRLAVKKLIKTFSMEE